MCFSDMIKITNDGDHHTRDRRMLRVGRLKAGEDRRSPAEPGVLQIVESRRDERGEGCISVFRPH